MICRVWHGITPRSKADAYASSLEQRAAPDYRSVPGNLSVAVLRRDEAEVTRFLTVTYWESEQGIRALHGFRPFPRFRVCALRPASLARTLPP